MGRRQVSVRRSVPYRTAQRQAHSRRRRVFWSAKDKATSTHKTFALGSVLRALKRGFLGTPVRTRMGKGRRLGHKQYTARRR